MHRLVLRIAVALIIGLAATPAPAQQLQDPLTSGRRIIRAERMLADERIVLDGILDEAVWKRAQHGGEFIQQDPVLGAEPTERTEVRFAFNRDHLYMGVICFDSEPDKLAGNTSKRDEFLSADDRFMWTMDTFLNQQTGYFFEMNPAGLMADALMGPGGSTNREWDGIWNARVRQSEIGWVIEIDIPFRTLAFDPNAPAWGVNFQRTVRRKQEELLWTGHQRNQGLRRMANAGLLVGLNEVSRGKGFEVKPYVAGYVDTPGGAATVGEADLGLDVAYNLTPSLRAVGTVNTDFAETEVDQRRVNLTRFPLFFPERRTFFLDGATFFDFPIQAFFSRRIGLVEGVPQRVIGGSKLTGQAGANDLGALYVRTGEDQGVPGEDFLVGRWRRRMLQQSYFGAIYTGRATRDAGDLPARQTFGADLRLATSTFRGNKNLEFTGYWIANTTENDAGDGAAWGARVEYPNDIWDLSLDLQEVQANFDPAIGFTPRNDFRRYNPKFRWNPRPKTRHPFIRRLGFGVDPFFLTDMQNRMESAGGNIQLFRMEMHSGDNFDAFVSPSYERLREDFEISEGITLPGGSDYRFTRWGISANTANRRVIALRPRAEWGTFFSGTRQEYELGVDIRPRPGIRVNTSYEYNTVDLAEGSFDTKLFRVVADNQFTPFMYLVNNIQYDSVSRILGWQSRFRWIVTPGNDVFVVYTQNWIDDFDPLDPARTGFRNLDRRTAAKVVFTKRF
ncbi:MAG: carbohydrate binding family 9 domain-containing protein [Acidobacteria bacterium]|nr:carbohydrate binding family 9 domain-containing protein [Acidobacteriota bacterium]